MLEKLNNSNIDYDTLSSDNIISTSTDLEISDNFINDSNKFYTMNERKAIVNKIDKIKNKKLYLKIFKIIHTNKCNYTVNTNGIFFNMTNIDNCTLYKIEQVIDKYEKLNKNINVPKLASNITMDAC